MLPLMKPEIYWLAQCSAQTPADDNWLAPAERAALARLTLPKRRTDWRLGRWTAKNLLTSVYHLYGNSVPLTEIEIHAANDGAPEVYVAGKPAPTRISISHSHGQAFCLMSEQAIALGCDLEKIEQRSANFVADYFTNAERRLCNNAPEPQQAFLQTLLWSGKESALKALRQGLRLDTRSVEIKLHRPMAASRWQPFGVDYKVAAQRLAGWYRCDGDFIRTIVTDVTSSTPVAVEAK